MFDFLTKRKRIYADYTASTPVRREVMDAMAPYFDKYFANAGSIIHEEGRYARDAIERSRKSIAQVLGVKSHEIIFTSGGTESNNLAIRGAVMAFQKKNPKKNAHVITTAIEHPSVLECFRYLESDTLKVTYLPVDESGRVRPDDVGKAMKDETILVSIMYVNNEIGTLQPIREIGKIIKDRNARCEKGEGQRVLYHTDASQGPLFYDMHVHNMNADLLTIDAQKIYGPKGVGILYRALETELEPIILGGKQEQNLRPGTENTPLIVGISRALEIASANRSTESKRLCELRDYFIELIESHVPQAGINGHKKHRSPNNINISIIGHEAEYLAVCLDREGIAVGTKSACIEGDESYVIEEMTKSREKARSSLRFTFGESTRRSDLEYIVKSLVRVLGSEKLT